MSVLCQISLVENERQFMELLSQGEAVWNRGMGGWGRFYGEIPAVGTTLQIDWTDFALENEEPFPEGYERDRERSPDYFKVIHHHRHLVPKPEYYGESDNETRRQLAVGVYSVSLCHVIVVKLSDTTK